MAEAEPGGGGGVGGGGSGSGATAATRREEEARVRHRLGTAFWQARDPERARAQLDAAAHLLESARRDLPRGAGEDARRMALFDAQTECLQVLQRALVRLGRADEALVVAERARNRAMVDLLRERQRASPGPGKAAAARLSERAPASVAEVVRLVNRQKAAVLYYSLAAGRLYSWLIVPTKGVVRFHQVKVSDDGGEDGEDECNFGSGVLAERIRGVRESLGVVTSSAEGKAGEEGGAGDGDGDGNGNGNMEDDMWSSHLDALGDRLNQDGDRSGFLRMVNRGSRLNGSSYSLSSLFSVGSVGGGCGSTVSSRHRHGSARSKRRHGWQGPLAARRLYELLLEPLEDDLPEGYPCELMIVPDGELYLVPWAMLRSPHCPEALCERYSLITAPSLTSIKAARNKSVNKADDADQQREGDDKILVVGNPKLPASVSEHWGWGDIPHAAQEASLVSEVLQAPAPLVGAAANKETVMSRLAKAECIHLACHVSWKLSAIVLSPGELVDSSSSSSGGGGGGGKAGGGGGGIGGTSKRYSINSDTIHEEEDLRSEVASSGADLDDDDDDDDDAPALSEFLLTAADVLNLRLSSAKLVVVSSCHTRDETHGAATRDGLVSLARALLAAGARCVMLSLWPVPPAAVKVVMRAMYSSMLQGARASR